MRLIRQARLYLQEGKSDKVYEVDLGDLGAGAGTCRYVVNFRYGRRGARLRDGTKTVTPVDLDEANQIFDSLVVSKTNKGYRESEVTSDVVIRETPAARDENAATPEQIILERLRDAKQQGLSAREVKRWVWRAGERRIRAAAAIIAAWLHSDDELLDYCIVWTLGRCADPSYVPQLVQAQKRYGLNHIGYLAREAQLSLIEPNEREAIYTAIKSQLPPSLATACQAQDSRAIVLVLEAMLHNTTPVSNDLLCDLYTWSRDRAPLHEALRQLFKTIAIQPNSFKALRRIFKQAEYRDDETMYAVLAHRFATATPLINRNGYSGAYVYDETQHKSLEFIEAVKKENPKIAFSSRTRDYLCRRSWRTLQHYGRRGNELYIRYAAAMLLEFSDADARQTYSRQYYDYEQRRYHERRFDGFAAYPAFNAILYLHSPNRRPAAKHNKWYIDGDAAEIKEFRAEAFPALWDQYPDQLIKLLSHSRCEPVHRFAVRALKSQKAFCAELSNEVIAKWLLQPYQDTNGFALQLAKDRIRRRQVDAILLAALLDSLLAEARQAAQDVINADSQWLLDDSVLLFNCIISPHEDVRLWIRRLSAELVMDEFRIKSLLARLTGCLLKLGEAEMEQQTRINDIGWVMLNSYTDQARQLSFEIIEDLLNCPAAAVQAVGARLLLNHATPADRIPAKLFRMLMEAPSAEVRSLGVQLFGQLDDTVLLQQPELLVSLVVSMDSEVRRAAQPIIARLAARDTAFANITLDKLMQHLFRAEPVEGFHEDILRLIQTDLNHAAQHIGKDTVWRLLQAKSAAAQRYGSHLLPRFKPEDFSVRQLARLAGNPILQVRQWSWRGYQNDPLRIKQHAQDALLILDSEAQDARQFGYDYFTGHFSEQDWNPDLLIHICDSVRDDVQQFGRELITRFFAAENGAQYLLKLSEHPAQNLQLFASTYLQQYAADHIDRLRCLLPYFLTVLSQVNRGRVAKARIAAFLGDEARKSQEAARLVAYIFSRQSVTAALHDKGRCIRLLLDIQHRYPDIGMPLKRLPPSRKAAT